MHKEQQDLPAHPAVTDKEVPSGSLGSRDNPVQKVQQDRWDLADQVVTEVYQVCLVQLADQVRRE